MAWDEVKLDRIYHIYPVIPDGHFYHRFRVSEEELNKMKKLSNEETEKILAEYYANKAMKYLNNEPVLG